MELHLEPEEASLLVRVVRNRLGELREEVHHTKDSEGREYLKHKEHILDRILRQFPADLDDQAHKSGFAKKG